MLLSCPCNQKIKKEEIYPMRIISVNTNGIRAAARKGFFEWMQKRKPVFKVFNVYKELWTNMLEELQLTT